MKTKTLTELREELRQWRLAARRAPDAAARMYCKDGAEKVLRRIEKMKGKK